MIDKASRYGEPMMWVVLISVFPVMGLWEYVAMPRGAILYWAIPALIITTIGFLLNIRYIDLQTERRKQYLATLDKRHKEVLNKFK
jgi:hypothetical protein